MNDPVIFGGSVARTRQDIRVALLKLDGLAEFNDRAQEYAVDLIARAQLRAAMCPGSEPILAQFVQAYALDAVGLQRGIFRRF